jgi:hypothetical protein
MTCGTYVTATTGVRQILGTFTPDVGTAVELNPVSGPLSGLWVSWPVRDAFLLGSPPKEVATALRAHRGAARLGVKFPTSTVKIRHTVSNSSSSVANFLALKGALYGPWIGPGWLSFTENGVAKRVRAEPLGITLEDEAVINDCLDFNVYVGEWLIYDHTRWANSASSVSLATITGTPMSVASSGTICSTGFTISLKPTAQKSAANGQRWVRELSMLWRGSRPAVDWPVMLMNDAAVAAMAGPEVYVDGRRVNHWIDGNKLWANLSLPAARRWKLATTSTGTGTGTWYLDAPIVDQEACPFYMIDSTATEVVRVDAVDGNTGAFTIGERGSRGSTATNWGAGAYFYLVPVKVDVLYGFSGTSLGYVNNDLKPIINLSSSTNSAFVYSNFYELAAANDFNRFVPRTASWRPVLSGPPHGIDISRDTKQGDGDMYVNYIPEPDANPATIIALAYSETGATAGKPLIDTWELYSPVKISTFAGTWRNPYRFLSGALPSGRTVGLRFQHVEFDGATITDDLVDFTDAPSLTAFSFSPKGAHVLALRPRPYDPKADYAIGARSAVEPSTSGPTAPARLEATAMTVTFDSGEVISWIVGAETAIYQFGRPDAPATLDIGGKTLKLHGLYLRTNQTMTIDFNEAIRALLPSGEAVGHLITGDNLCVPPGTNSLTLTETNGTSVQASLAWRDGWA